MRGLYAILDVTSLANASIDPLVFARHVLAAGPAALQVRAKELPARELLALLRAVSPLVRGAGVPLVCNDRPDVAALGGADMVHLGQGDVPIDLVRRLSPTLRVGLSTHTLEQLSRALAQRPDYVAYGPVFATSSKLDPDPVVALEGLAAARALVAAESPATPLVAIGGIDLARAASVAAHADAGAVIGHLLGAGEAGIEARARALHAALGGASS